MRKQKRVFILLLTLIVIGFVYSYLVFKIRISKIDNYRIRNELPEVLNDYLLTKPVIGSKQFISYLDIHYPHVKDELNSNKFNIGVRMTTTDSVILYEFGPDLIDNLGERSLDISEYGYLDFIFKKDKDILISITPVSGYMRSKVSDEMELDKIKELENFKKFVDSIDVVLSE